MTEEHAASVGVVRSEPVFEHGFWRLTSDTALLPDGRERTVVRAHHVDTVHVVAVQDDDRVLLLREFRAFHGRYRWMIPSGKADKESDMVAAAQRELREETGMRARTLTPLFTGMFYDHAPIRYHVFVGRDLVRDPLPQDDLEIIEVHALPLSEAIDRVLTELPLFSQSAIALLTYERQLKDIR